MGIKKSIPNFLTLLRILMAGIAIICLEYSSCDPKDELFLIIALILFILASTTDALDGALARKWNAETKFGRILDPVADKLLIIGTLIELAGPQFQLTIPPLENEIPIKTHLTGIQPWMVIVVFFREIFVTSLRAIAESQGIAFPANWGGKAKMMVQSIAIPGILLIIVFFSPGELPPTDLGKEDTWITSSARFIQIATINSFLASAIILITILSIIPYVNPMKKILSSSNK